MSSYIYVIDAQTSKPSKNVVKIGSTKKPDKRLKQHSVARDHDAKPLALYRIVEQEASEVDSMLRKDKDRGFVRTCEMHGEGGKEVYELPDLKLLEDWFCRNSIRYRKAVIHESGYTFPDTYTCDPVVTRCWANIFTILGWSVKCTDDILLLDSGSSRILAKVFNAVVHIEDSYHRSYLCEIIRAMKFVNSGTCIIIGLIDEFYPDCRIGYSDTYEPVGIAKDNGNWIIGPYTCDDMAFEIRTIWKDCYRITERLKISGSVCNPEPKSVDKSYPTIYPCLSSTDEKMMIEHIMQEHTMKKYYPTQEDIERYIKCEQLPGMTVSFNSTSFTWTMNGKRHNVGDMPCYVSKSRRVYIWREMGIYHRDNDLPSVIKCGKNVSWHKHGVLHRDYGPAYIDNYSVIWYRNGNPYRVVGQFSDDIMIKILTTRIINILCRLTDIVVNDVLKPSKGQEVIKLFLLRAGATEEEASRIMEAGYEVNSLQQLEIELTRNIMKFVGNIEIVRSNLKNVMIKEALIQIALGDVDISDELVEEMVEYVRLVYDADRCQFADRMKPPEDYINKIIPGRILSENEREWYWTVNGMVHSVNDMPACISKPARKRSKTRPKYIWMKEGAYHRDGDLPAKIMVEKVSWYRDGLRHREDDKPAIMGITIDWYWNGKLYRRVGDRYCDKAEMQDILTFRMIDYISRSVENMNEGTLMSDEGRRLIKLFLLRAGVMEEEASRVSRAKYHKSNSTWHLVQKIIKKLHTNRSVQNYLVRTMTEEALIRTYLDRLNNNM